MVLAVTRLGDTHGISSDTALGTPRALAVTWLGDTQGTQNGLQGREFPIFLPLLLSLALHPPTLTEGPPGLSRPRKAQEAPGLSVPAL